MKKRKFKDFTGLVFERLTVLELSHEVMYGSQRTFYWNCLCDCGNTKVVQSSNLRAGHVRSCGCKYKDVDHSILNKTHGLTNTREYKCWEGMKARCNNPNSTHYSRYGGRGIKVCDRWNNSFENFIEDMRYQPSNKHSIDRIDVNGNYEPDNCRWATDLEQVNNRRNTVRILYKDENLTIKEWSEKTGIKETILRDRYYRKLPLDKIFSNKNKKYLRDLL